MANYSLVVDAVRGREDPGLVEQRRSAHVEILRFLQDGSLQKKKSEISLRIRKDGVDFFFARESPSLGIIHK